MQRFCRCPLSIHALIGLLVLGSLFGGAVPVQAKGCAEGSPAAPVPGDLWGELQPERILIDATKWTGSQRPTMAYQISTSVDIENGFVFDSFYGGFSIWDARTNPGNPQRLGIVGGYEGMFPSWPQLTEFTQIVFYIDAPAGDDSIAAVAAITPVGLSIWDTADKSSPRPLYQDKGKFMYQVYTARIGGRDWAFGADFQSSNGLHLYDMTAARAYSWCAEDKTAGQTNCPGVYKQRIGLQEATKYVHGLAVGNRHFVVKSGGYLGARGVQIWEVTTPTSPQLVMEDFRTTTGANGFIYGMAMWTQGSRHYLALRQAGDAKIFDITTCLTQGCSNLNGLLVWQQALKPYPESLYWLSVTFSRSGNTPFLYFGNHETCRQGKAAGQTEYLFDVSNAAAPREVTPKNTLVVDGETADETVDYWSWYYSTYNKGFSHFGPRAAKFHGPYLYRAGATLFDVHRWTISTPPTPNFTSAPLVVYAGDPVTFTSTSTGTITTYNWTFQDGTPTAVSPSPSACTPAASGPRRAGGPACSAGPR
jgi:hypothetical protein